MGYCVKLITHCKLKNDAKVITDVCNEFVSRTGYCPTIYQIANINWEAGII